MKKHIFSETLLPRQSTGNTVADYQLLDYPYSSNRIVLGWKNRKFQAFGLIAIIAVILATWNKSLLRVSIVDDIILRVAFPAVLAVILAAAPSPISRLGRIAKDLAVVSLIMAIFGGDNIPIEAASFPLVLAASVVIDKTRLGNYFWRSIL